MNENPSVRIELARSKTSNNGPLRNGSVVSIARLYVYSKIVCFYESDHAFKTIWRRPCSCHLVKINRYFFQPGRPVFIIVINTSCSGVCYRIYARQNFLNNALAPNGALALFGIFITTINRQIDKQRNTQTGYDNNTSLVELTNFTGYLWNRDSFYMYINTLVYIYFYIFISFCGSLSRSTFSKVQGN